MAMRVYKDPFAEAKAKKKEEKRKRDAKNEAGEKDKKQRGIAQDGNPFAGAGAALGAGGTTAGLRDRGRARTHGNCVLRRWPDGG